MSFLTPFYLLGLLAVAIPVILHLINFRRPKKQAFSTLVFFKQLQKSSMKRLKLKKRLLLAIRIAAICLLAFALARPMLAPGSAFNFGSGSVLHMILLENGPAMSQIDERGPLMDTAREAVARLAENAGNEDRFLIYNTHGELMMTEEVGPDQALRLLNNTDYVNAGNFTTERLTALLSRSEATDRDHRSLYVVGRGSDHLREQLGNVRVDVDFNTGLMPLTLVRTGEQPSPNVAVTGLSSRSQIVAAGRPVTLDVEVRNFGEQAVHNYFLSLEMDGEVAGQYQINLDEGQSNTFSFEVVPPADGGLTGRAVLEGDPVSFDNSRYFAFELPETRSILLITPERSGNTRVSWLEPVFEAARRTAGQIEVNRITWDNFNSGLETGPDAIILEGVRDIPEYAWSDLISFVQQGGGLVLFPGEGGTPDRFNRFLERANAGRYTGILGDPGRFENVARVGRIVRGHPILDDIFELSEEEDVQLDMPGIFHYWRYNPAGGSAHQRILNTNLDDPLLVQHNLGEGRIFISAIHTSPSWSAFSVNPLFAPLFYRLGLYAAAGESGGLNEFVLGNQFEWYAGSGFTRPEIELNEIMVVPETRSVSRGIRMTSDTDEWTPGVATIASEEDTVRIAVNQNITESDFRTLSEQQLSEAFSALFEVSNIVTLDEPSDQNLAARLGAAGTGREIWNWLVLIGIILLLSESVVTRKFDGDKT